MAAPVAQYGSYSIASLLATSNTSVIDYTSQGDEVWQPLRAYVDEYNRLVNEQVEMFAERTRMRTVGVGGVASQEAVETDEGGVADTQKSAGPDLLGFPLRKHQYNTQATRHWLRKHTPAELVARIRGGLQADNRRLQYRLREAIFRPTNRNFTDRLVDNMTVPVMAFANADSFPIPAGSNATTFNAATHSHYTGTASALPTDAELDALVSNVSEHFASGQQFLFANATLGNALIAGRNGVSGGAYPSFVIPPYTGQQVPITQAFAPGMLNKVNRNNRFIGQFNGVDVWVKPWVPPLVAWTFFSGEGIRKPLAFRVPDDMGGDNGEFRLVFDDDQFPNVCEVMEREYGFGVWNRVAGAVLSYNSGGTDYVQPDLN